MSLNWNISNCENHEELFYTWTDEFGVECKRLNGLTEALIFASMVTGLGKSWSLTEEYAPEFYARVKMLEKLNGPLAWKPKADGKGHEDWLVTPEDIHRHVGLHVNVSPVSRAAFVKRIASYLDDDVKRYGKSRLTATEKPASLSA